MSQSRLAMTYVTKTLLILLCDEWTIIKGYFDSVQCECSKSECSSGSPLSQTLEVESQKHTMAFSGWEST